MHYPLISIVVANYNGVKLNVLQECLEHFKNLDYPNFEFFLIDNASTDDSLKVAKRIIENDERFKIIKNPVNMYSEGMNLGFRAAHGKFIALFNNDVVTEKKYLQKLVMAFDRHPKLAIAQGKFMWYFDHSIIDSAGETMDIYGNPVTLGYQTKDSGLFDKEEEVLSASGAACLIKKSALDEIGFYDPHYGIGYEDMDHSLRFRHKGYSTMRIPSAVCYHKRGVTDLSPLVRIKVRWHFNKNRLSTMVRNYPLPLLIKTLPVTLCIYIGNMLWELLILRNTPLALTRPKAIWWTIGNFGYLLNQRAKIRVTSSSRTDRKILKLFAQTDLLGKMKVVIMDKFSIKVNR